MMITKKKNTNLKPAFHALCKHAHVLVGEKIFPKNKIRNKKKKIDFIISGGKYCCKHLKHTHTHKITHSD